MSRISQERRDESGESLVGPARSNARKEVVDEKDARRSAKKGGGKMKGERKRRRLQKSVKKGSGQKERQGNEEFRTHALCVG